MMKEVDIPRKLDHRCITKVLEVYDSDKLFVIVMELVPGGDLFDQVLREYDEEAAIHHSSEVTAKLRFYQIIHATAHLHAKCVYHRDLKLENILLIKNSSVSLLKITDFGPFKQFSSVWF